MKPRVSAKLHDKRAAAGYGGGMVRFAAIGAEGMREMGRRGGRPASPLTEILNQRAALEAKQINEGGTGTSEIERPRGLWRLNCKERSSSGGEKQERGATALNDGSPAGGKEIDRYLIISPDKTENQGVKA